MKKPIHALCVAPHALSVAPYALYITPFARRVHAPRALLLACAAALSTQSFNALAQTPEANEKPVEIVAPAVEVPVATLPAVVVTATGNSQLITHAIAHTTVISRQDIVRSQATDVATLLSREAGFQFTQNGGRGTVSGLFLRGSPALQVLVLIDGIAMTKQDASGAISLEHLMLDQVDHIEVVRGNVSAVYGSGAVGGVIQIFTKKGGKNSASVTTEIGSRGSFKLAANTQAALGEGGVTKLAAGYGSNRTDGFSAMNTVQNPKANPDSDGYTNHNWSLAASHRLSSDHLFGFTTNHSLGKMEFDTSFGTPLDVQTGRTNLDTLTVYSENKLSTQWFSKFSIAKSIEKNTNKYPNPSDSYVSKNTSFLWKNVYSLNDKWTLTSGLEHQQQSANVNDGWGGIYSVKRNVDAIFTGMQGSIKENDFQFNLRKDIIHGTRSPITTYFGYGFNINQNLKIIATNSNAFNIAPLGYLYAPGFGNSKLNPEKSKSNELGIQYTLSNDLLRATYFSTNTKNQFDCVLYSEYDCAFQNITSTKNSGLELSYTTLLPSKGDIRTSLTLQNPKDTSTGQTLNRRAKTMAALTISQPVGAWLLGTDFQYRGSAHDTGHALKAFVTADASVRYSIDKQWNAFARLENLANAQHQTVYGYNSTPRGLFIGLNWQPTF